MKKITYVFLGTVILSMFLSAQTIVKVPSDNPPEMGNLNTAVQTATDAGTLSNTIFELEPVGYYVLTGTINVPAGKKLTIVAPDPGKTQATAPPQILWAPTGGLDRSYFFNCYGDISLKNVWLLAATTIGDQVGSSILMSDDPNSKARRITLEGVIIDYVPCPALAAGSVTITCKNLIGVFKNSYWKNNIDRHLKYYGRIISFPYATTGWHADSVTFENCTFANIGYGIMQEGDEYYSYVKLNHCTFLNSIMHALEYGWWQKIAVTNCIFANTQLLGQVPAQTSRVAGDPEGATLRIDSITQFNFTVPFTEQDRRILFTNSVHHLDPWVVDWMITSPWSKKLKSERRNNEIPIPMPMLSPQTQLFFNSVNPATGTKMFPYMNISKVDSINPLFFVPPTDTGSLKAYINKKWDDNSDTNWAWKPSNSIGFLWPLEENLAYKNTTVKTAGMGGLPLGDLYRWWPAEYTTWLAQKKAEDSRIATWLETGKDPGATSVENQISIPAKYELSQNFPNPFNPETQIRYSIPEKSNVVLKVYNILGSEVATLVNEVKQTGNYECTFDGKNIASGIYFYRLQAGNISITKKLILMK